MKKLGTTCFFGCQQMEKATENGQQRRVEIIHQQ